MDGKVTPKMNKKEDSLFFVFHVCKRMVLWPTIFLHVQAFSRFWKHSIEQYWNTFLVSQHRRIMLLVKTYTMIYFSNIKGTQCVSKKHMNDVDCMIMVIQKYIISNNQHRFSKSIFQKSQVAKKHLQ